VAVDGTVLYAFITFRRARLMAGTLLVAGAVTTYMLQRWHAEQAAHPLIVAGVVPGLMVLVTLAWHLIRDVSQDVSGSRSPRQQAATPAPLQPVSQVSQRPNLPARPNGLTPAQRRRVEAMVADGRTNKSQMARDLGLTSDRQRKNLGRLVNDLLAQNGDRPKEPVG
jgi:hypothetical protein